MTAQQDSTPDILSISPEDYRRLCLQLEHRAEVQLLQARIVELEQDLAECRAVLVLEQDLLLAQPDRPEGQDQ